MADLLEARMQLYSGKAPLVIAELRRLLTNIETRAAGVTSRTEQFRRILGEGLLRAGQNQAALDVLNTTYLQQRAMTSETHSSVATTQVLLGCAYARLGQRPLALEHWTAAERNLSASLGATHPFTLTASGYLALAAPQANQSNSSNQTRRHTLARSIEESLAWQSGAATLAQWLRNTPAAADGLQWAQLPVVL